MPTQIRKIDRVTFPGLDHLPGMFQLQHYRSSCVYFLCLGDEIVYVGKTNDLHGRVTDHRKNKTKPFDRIFFMPCDPRSMTELEAALIIDLRPRYNIRTKPPLECRDISAVLENIESGYFAEPLA